MAVRYTPTQVNHGFDRTARPDWQMVPVGRTRSLWVSGSDGLVPRVVNADPNRPVLTITTSGAGAKVQLSLTGGRSPGRARVEWVPPGFGGTVSNDFMLEVSVKREIRVDTAFHYVNDGRRQVTDRKIDDLDAMIAGANAILTPQANVVIWPKSATELVVAQNLGRVVRYSSNLEGPPWNVDPAKHEWDDLQALSDTTADFNVFFVSKYEQDIHPRRDNHAAGTLDGMCIFQDRVSEPATLLAHEMIHALGVDPHRGARRRHLMSRYGPHGHFIPKDQINIANRTGT